MNKTKRILAALLAALMLMPAMAACDTDTPDTSDTPAKQTTAADTTAAANTDTSSADTTAVETEPKETERHEIKDTLPKDLNYGGRTFTIYVGGVHACEDFVLGLEEREGEVVNDAVYERNAKVQDQLGFKMKADPFAVDWSSVGKSVSTLILAGDSTHDIILGQEYGMTSLVSQNMFVNAYELDHLDFDQPWWMNGYMNEVALGTKYRFLLLSDFNTHAISNIRVNLFNKDLYEKIYGDPNELYTAVLDGKFTIDYMSNLIKGAYVDLNGDGITDVGDQLGLITNGLYASVDSFVYSTDIAFTVRDEDGFVQLNMEGNEKGIALAEKLCPFFHQPAVFTKSGGAQTDFFAKGNVLFMGNGMLVDTGTLRDMDDDFGVLPHPKFDEAQKEYQTLLHTGALLSVIPKTTKNLDMAGAVLEALSAESYRRVTPAYYEVALKQKYSRDSLSTRMLDLLKNTMSTNFIYAYTASLNNIGDIYRTMITNNLPNYVSNVEARIGAAETNLADLIKVFKGE